MSIMKKFSYIFIIIISLLFITNVKADHISRYEPSFKPEKGILNNNVAIFFGINGEDVTETSFTFSYDNRFLEYDNIELLNEFDDYEIKVDKIDGKWTTYKVKVNVEYCDDYFGILNLKAKSSFVSGKSTDVFFYNYEGKSEVSKYRHTGKVLTLNRNNKNELVYQESIIDKSIQIKYWILENLLMLISIAAGFIILISVFLFTPIFNKRQRENSLVKEEKKEEVEETVSLGLYNKFEGNVVVNDKEEQVEIKEEEEIELPKKIVPEGHETENGMYVYNPEFDNNDKNE